MNRGTIRTMLRRQVKDTASVQFPTNSELDEVINMAYGLVQKEIRKVDPEAHLFWDTLNLDAGVNWYPLPSSFSLQRVGVKSAASDTLFKKLEYKRYDDLVEISGATQYYSIRGQWVGIFPAPSTSITNGLELVHN